MLNLLIRRIILRLTLISLIIVVLLLLIKVISPKSTSTSPIYLIIRATLRLAFKRSTVIVVLSLEYLVIIRRVVLLLRLI